MADSYIIVLKSRNISSSRKTMSFESKHSIDVCAYTNRKGYAVQTTTVIVIEYIFL